MKNNKKFEEWEKFHEHMFKPLENKNTDEGWIELEEIFRKN